MTLRRFLKQSPFFLSFLVLGCGVSPLLHHKKEVKNSSNQNGNQSSNPGDDQGCVARFDQIGLCVKQAWKTGPVEAEESVLELTFFDLKNPNQNWNQDLGIEAELWMPSMGHGSAPVSIEMPEKHRALIKEIYFIMKGKWEIRFHVFSGPGNSIRWTENVEI